MEKQIIVKKSTYYSSIILASLIGAVAVYSLDKGCLENRSLIEENSKPYDMLKLNLDYVIGD